MVVNQMYLALRNIHRSM